MNRIPLPYTVLLLAAAAAFGTARPEPLLRDGSALDGLDGTVTRLESNTDANYLAFDTDNIWLFVPASDVNDYAGLVKAGTPLQLLPSTALEKLLADLAGRQSGSYRLWGSVTRYKNANYIFPTYFIPLASPEPQEPPEAKTDSTSARPEPNQPPRPAAKPEPNEPKTPAAAHKPTKPPAPHPTTPAPGLTDPNGLLQVPREVLDKLSQPGTAIPRPIRPARQPAEKPEAAGPEPNQPPPRTSAKKPAGKPAQARPEDRPGTGPSRPPTARLDSMLIGRTAILQTRPDGRLIFTLDALGFSVQTTSLIPLPNEILELTEAEYRSALNPPRFKIAGIKTRYKGKTYLLLQKAIRAYSHGNFGR